MAGVATVAMLWAACAAAETGRAKPGRSVQLIAMDARAEQTGSEAAETSGMTNAPETAPLPPEFRVHDLSRRWVAFQMGSSFANSAGALDPADAGASRPGTTGFMPPAPAISVPLWMRTGAGVAAPVARFEPGCAALPYRPTGFLKADAEFRRSSYYGLMSAIACEHGIPVGLFDAMIIRESRYRTDALSPKSAFGLTQLMPGTAAYLGVNRYSIEGNLRGGAKYLREQLDTFGHYHLALAAYNAGPGRIRGGMVPRIAETRAYVDNVLTNWARLSGVYRHTIVLPGQSAAAGAPAALQQGRMASVSLFQARAAP